MNEELKNAIDHQIDKTIERANLYNSVICGIGYGAYFAILAVGSERIPDVHLRFSLLCMTASVTIYVVWEVIKVTVNAQALRMLIQIREASPGRVGTIYDKNIERMNRIQDRLGKYWVFVLVTAVVLALMSASTLAFQLINGLGFK